MTNYREQVEDAQKEIDFDIKKYQVALRTNKGDIKIDLWPDVAPNHCKNIVGLAKCGFYDGLSFHRVIPGFVIQGGCPRGNGTGGPGYNVDAEFNERLHEAGVLSMARASDPDSAGSQFFICLDKVPYLDGQYTAFGQTHDDESLAVVKSIGGVETDGNDKPIQAVTIEGAEVIEIPIS